MVFVNDIAQVVHTQVVQHSGSPNKNIGEAFLLVWKIKRKGHSHGKDGHRHRAGANDGITEREAANGALRAAIGIIEGLQFSERIRKWPKADKIMRHNRDFQVRLGIGLHAGWGIEGAIGSEHKIDASYLSPNVNLAARLETATHIYGVPILLSEQVLHMLSDELSSQCRLLDKVAVKGSSQPMKIYTYDAYK